MRQPRCLTNVCNTLVRHFCNIPLKELRADSLTELKLYNKGVGVPGALVVAHFLPVSASLTAAHLQYNRLDDAAKQMLRDSVKDRAGFKLEL